MRPSLRGERAKAARTIARGAKATRPRGRGAKATPLIAKSLVREKDLLWSINA